MRVPSASRPGSNGAYSLRIFSFYSCQSYSLMGGSLWPRPWGRIFLGLDYSRFCVTCWYYLKWLMLWFRRNIIGNLMIRRSAYVTCRWSSPSGHRVWCCLCSIWIIISKEHSWQRRILITRWLRSLVLQVPVSFFHKLPSTFPIET